MSRTILTEFQNHNYNAKSKIRLVLLCCGILSSVIYVITDIIASISWLDYSYTSQTVSELIGINAPTRPLVASIFIVYAILIYAFGIGIWLSADNKRIIKSFAALIIAKEILGLVITIFFPIHLRGIEGNYSDTMHGILTAVGVFLCMFPAMIGGAIAFKGPFRIYSIITMILFIIFGVLAGSNQPQYVVNMATPMMGVYERINIYGYMIWIVILSNMFIRFKYFEN